jgi:hypothetical protein
MPRSRKSGPVEHAEPLGEETCPTHVTVVSNNPETLDELSGYLGRAGVPAHCTRAIEDVSLVAPDFATAAVIFPDDFAESVVVALVAELRVKRPRLLILFITRAPNRLRSILRADDRSLPPIVLPRPSFGWDILDAIRIHSYDTSV